MSEPGQDAALGGLLEQGRQLVRPVLGVLGLTVIVLSVAGAATAYQPAAAQGLFISILFFSCLAAFLVILSKVVRSPGRSKYQINEKPVKSGGLVNSGYDQEKGDKPGAEPWMNNYVPYGKNPSGSPIEQVTFTREDEKDGQQAGEEGNKNNMAKDGESENTQENDDSCVPYEETDEDTDEDDSKHEKETVADRGEKADNKDEKDVDEKEVDSKDEGTEKL